MFEAHTGNDVATAGRDVLQAHIETPLTRQQPDAVVLQTRRIHRDSSQVQVECGHSRRDDDSAGAVVSQARRIRTADQIAVDVGDLPSQNRLAVRRDQSRSLCPGQHDAASVVAGDLQVMEIETVGVRARDRRPAGILHDKRRDLVVVADVDDVPAGAGDGVGQVRIQSRVAEPQIGKQSRGVGRVGNGLSERTKCCRRRDGMRIALAEQAGKVRQRDRTPDRTGRRRRVATQHHDQVGLAGNGRRQLQVERILVGSRAGIGRRSVRIDPDHEVSGVGSTDAELARIVRSHVDRFIDLGHRDTPLSIDGHQHAIASRPVGKESRRLEPGESPIRHEVHVRAKQIVGRDHRPQREIVRDPTFHSSAEPRRRRAVVLTVRIRTRVTAQPRQVGSQRHSDFSVAAGE